MVQRDANEVDEYRPGCPLQDVLATNELGSRPTGNASDRREHEAMVQLAAVMAEDPDRVLATLADVALALCGAGSAGISLEDLTASPPVFRWKAVAGRMAALLDGTMPRDFSPCTETVECN